MLAFPHNSTVIPLTDYKYFFLIASNIPGVSACGEKANYALSRTQPSPMHKSTKEKTKTMRKCCKRCNTRVSLCCPYYYSR